MKIFKSIYKFFDKIIVIPISRLVFNTQNSLKRKGKVLDKILNQPSFLIYLSLILAVLFFLLIDNKVITLVENNAEVITNVPVKLKYNEEAYVIEGAPKTVDITISGRKSDIYLSKQIGEYEVFLDLSSYTASDSAYKVYFTYSKNIDNLVYKLDPSYVSVMVKNKVSSVSSVTHELINQDKLDSKLSVKNVSLSKSEVVVKGSETSLKKIAWVKALVDLGNKESDLKEAKTYDIDCKLVAYDNTGNILNNVEIVPNTLSATIELDSYSANIPVVVKTKGKLLTGKSISSIQINDSSEFSITIYGNESLISNLTSIPVTIDIEGLGNDNAKVYNVTLSKPTGVRYMSDSSVKVSLSFGNEQQKAIGISSISHKNLGSGLKANIISDTKISVIAKGVASVLENITEKDINAYVDLSGLGVGEHDVKVQIVNENSLVSYEVSSNIKVRITSE
ncbi:MAG: hypothetical protein GX951_01745 [Mollicutes bacterium]|nr:hypothetical protein [Mollicutes bacterium]